MVVINNSDYYSKIPAGRDFNNLPADSSAGTTVGYQYDGFTEEDRFVQKVLREHYDKMYRENMSHSDPMAYVRSKYCDVTWTPSQLLLIHDGRPAFHSLPYRKKNAADRRKTCRRICPV